LDVSVGNTEIGRIILELFADVTPKTAENFRQLCTGEYKPNGIPMGYKGTSTRKTTSTHVQLQLSELLLGSSFHRVIKDFMIQGGDFVHSDGTGVMNIYNGTVFPDENFSLKHDAAGLLSMANSGKDTNGCQFFITCSKCNFLDNKHVVFGRVIDGLLIVRKIENVPIGSNNKPRLPISVSQCGQM
jgi:peptidyl-prolyl isomerase H (cyclophilin H)